MAYGVSISMKFSIIIPVYNVAPYLRECLDSVLAQTFDGWECICVNDGSTDGSSSILDEYASKDKRFRIIHKENEGVSVARNLALDQARGDWVCFLDSDDIWDVETLDHVNGIIEKENPDLVRFRFKHFNQRALPCRTEQNRDYKVIADKDLINKFVNDELIQNGFIWLLFIRRNLVDGIRFPVGVKYAEDALFALEVFSKLTTFVQSEFVGYHYRLREDSAMRRPFCSKERLLFLREFERVSKLYPQSPNKSWMAWFAVLNWILRPNDVDKAIEIRALFKKLCDDGEVDISLLKSYAGIAAISYKLFGWLWPTRCIYGLIKLLRS